jgi:hypothetical protein
MPRYREGPRQQTHKEDQTPRAVEISYFCDITPAEEFGRLLWATGGQRLADQAHEVIFVADGAVWIWNLVADHFQGGADRGLVSCGGVYRPHRPCRLWRKHRPERGLTRAGDH